MFLPKSASLDESEAHIPRISSVLPGSPRPFWSVMVPTYNSGKHLRRTLESVLRQDPGPEQMQIEVVDGGSTTDNPEEVVKELGQGRVGFYRLQVNKGPATTFNAAISRSHGRWVHLLHGDDMVSPRFYETFADAINRHPGVVMALSGSIIIDEHDRVVRELPRADVDHVGIIRG